MKCLCGYEHKSGYTEDMKEWKEHLIGDEDFKQISGSTFKIRRDGFWNEKEVELYICPKCGTVRAGDN